MPSMPSMPSESHSATSTSSALNSSTNISNVNRFHTQSTTNFVATPAECNSSASANTANCANLTNSLTNSSLTALTTTSASAQFLELPNTCAADLAVAAAAKAAYDFAGLTAANFHRSHTQSHHSHTHPSVSTASSSATSFAAAYLGDCGVGVDTFANGLSASWGAAAHQSAAAFAAASHHHYGHQIPSFGPHCDLRTAFAISVPTTSSNCAIVTTGSVPAMTVQRVNESVRANSASNSSASLPHQNANIISNGISPNFTISANTLSNKTSKPRRRVATMAQRRAANIRERRRMFNLNSAFDKLRKKVPTFAYEKRLSRIETLRLAIMYIGFMTEVVRGKDPCFEPRIPLHPSGSYQNHQHDRDREHIWNGNHYPFNTFSDSFQTSRY